VTRPRKIRWLDRRDAVAVSVLLGIPTLALSIAALAGLSLLTGDDLTQKLPALGAIGPAHRSRPASGL